MTYIWIFLAVGICFYGGFLRGRAAERKATQTTIAELQQKLLHAQMGKCRAERITEFYKKELKR